MLTIRPFNYTDADYQMLDTLEILVFPNQYHISIEEWKHFDATRPAELPFVREVIESDGVMVAIGFYGQSQWAYHPRKFQYHVNVHPDYEYLDVRPFYFEHVLQAIAPHDPIAITAFMREDKEAYIRFLQEMGFYETMRTPIVSLDVAAFDPTPFIPAAEKVQAMGIRIVSLSELMEIDPDWKQKLHDLDWGLAQDVPSPEPVAQLSFEDWAEMTFNPKMFSADGWFIALDGDSWVGMSHVWLNPGDTTSLYNSLTGVIRSYRRRGIALALKLRLIDFAKQYGAVSMITGNEEDNPIYKLNMKLGFKSLPAWIDYEKTLKVEEPAS